MRSFARYANGSIAPPRAPAAAKSGPVNSSDGKDTLAP